MENARNIQSDVILAADSTGAGSERSWTSYLPVILVIGGSLAMPLPDAVARLIRDEGLELGHAMDRISGEYNVKHRQGAVGILTAGLVDRQAAYEVILTYALARFLTPALW